MNPEIVDASNIKRTPRKSPADQLLEDIEGDYTKLTDVAKILGVHQETLRRLCRTNKVNAPTKAVQQGGMTMYLFTDEDIVELVNYFQTRNRTVFTLDKELKRDV